MHFKAHVFLLFAVFAFSSCGTKCNQDQNLIVGVWTDNIGRYQFHKDQSYSYKFLAGNNTSDTLSVADSAFGTYKIDHCQKVISLLQTGYYSRKEPSVYVPKHINFGTWKFSHVNDSLMEIETVSTYMKLRKQSGS